MKPQLFGTNATSVFNNAPTGSTTMFPNGVLFSQAGAMGLRTPVGTSIEQQGALNTLFGGDTATPSCPPPMPCVGAHLTNELGAMRC